MTRNRCTALCAALHSTDRQRERNREQMSKREVDGVQERYEIRDGIKHCETERVNETEKGAKKAERGDREIVAE